MKNVRFVLLLTLLGCAKKEELPECPGACTVVTGRLLTSGSVPFPNAPVTLQWRGGRAYAPQLRKKAVATTDANGRYRVSGFLSDAELTEGFITVTFSPDKSTYYLIGEPQLAYHHPRRDTLYAAPDFLIPRKGFMSLVVTNPSQIPAPYSFYLDLSSCYGGNTVFNQNILGGAASVSLSGLPAPYTLEVPADQLILVRLRKNGAYALPHDTISVPAGHTLSYILTY